MKEKAEQKERVVAKKIMEFTYDGDYLIERLQLPETGEMSAKVIKEKKKFKVVFIWRIE